MKDLSLHILDIMQNSVEAGAQEIRLTVRVDRTQDDLMIEIVDDGKGMDEALLATVTDAFTTSRTSRKVGLGLPLFKMTAEMTGGSLHIDSEPGQGTRVTAHYGYNHIDRPPLGKVWDSIISFLAGVSSVELVFELDVVDRKFTFSTVEVKEILENDEFYRYPKILNELKEYLRTNISETFGGDVSG